MGIRALFCFIVFLLLGSIQAHSFDSNGVWLLHTNGTEEFFGTDWRAITNAQAHQQVGDTFYIGTGSYPFVARTGVKLEEGVSLQGGGRPVYDAATHSLTGGTILKGTMIRLARGAGVSRIGMQPVYTGTVANGITSFGVAGQFGLLWTNEAENTISGVTVFCETRTLNHGIEVYGASGTIRNCHIVNVRAHGIVVKGGRDWLVEDCTVEEGCANNAFLTKAASGSFGNVSNVIFRRCTARDVVNNGVHVFSDGPGDTSGNNTPYAYATNWGTVLESCLVDGAGTAVRLNGSRTYDVQIRNCVFRNYGAVAFRGGQEDNPGNVVTNVMLDQDGDSIEDWWEIEHGGDSTSMDPGADDDGDGQVNGEEWVALTDPFVEDSTFSISATVVSNASLELSWPGDSRRRYILKASDFPGGETDNLTTNNASTFKVPLTSLDERRFFSVEVLPPGSPLE